LALVAQDRQVEQNKMKAGGGRLGETGRISDMARQIAAS
jgi:hypothetical protein